MTTGNTYTGTLTDSLNSMVAAARAIRDYTTRMPSLVTRETLKDGTGTTWNEVSFAQLTASSVAESEELENPQQYSDTNFAITPTLIGVHTVITERVRRRIAPVAFQKMGKLAQNAIERKKDVDGLTVLDGATNSLSGTGTTLQSGIISAAVAQINGNTTEPADSPIVVVLHPYQLNLRAAA